jgi:soluble lytic murein transglycosylase
MVVRRILVCTLTLAACRGEAAPTPLIVPPKPVDAAAEDRSAEPERPSRELWFSDGPGREALLARERRDHAAAAEHLDELLGRPGLSRDDRGAALLLRALEDLRGEHFAEAATRLAEARGARALAPLERRIRLLEAQARLDAGDPRGALAAVESLPEEGTLAGDLMIVIGDARRRTDDREGARRAYETYLQRWPKGRRAHEVRAKLAGLLTTSEESSDLRRALELYESIVLEVPLSNYSEEAESGLRDLRRRGHRGRRGGAFAQRHELARLHALVDHRRYAEASRRADAFLRKRGLPGSARCEAGYLKGTAVFKQRERARARPAFERAAKACKRAGAEHRDTAVKCLYQAARGRYAEGRHARAARAFQALARDYSSHSYADDALVLAGESWTEAGDPKRARAAYMKALGVEGGDMAAEARRRIVVMAFSAGEPREAVDIVDAALARGVASRKERAKLHYFRGKALAALGKKEEATAAWVEAVRTQPLGYAALQALSRLREQGAAGLERGLAVLRGEGGAPTPVSFELPRGPGTERATLLARLGLGAEARDELESAGVEGWPAVAVLHQAGLYAESQRMLARMRSAWRTQPPVSTNDRAWEIAHPRPFIDLVEGREREHGVPTLLAYAIMQTESRFDPGVTSWAGARGLMQLMPSTAENVANEAGIDLSSPDRLYDPATNLDLGARHLASVVTRHGGGEGAVTLAVPSYNAGIGAVRRWLSERGDWDLDLFIESIPYDETRKYTQSVLGRWLAYRWIYAREAGIPFLPLRIPKASG